MTRAVASATAMVSLLTWSIWAQPAMDTTPKPESILSRFVQTPRPIVLRPPPGPCTVARVAAYLATSMEFPAGVEQLPGRCTPDPPISSATSLVPLTGLTVFDAMETLVKLDPRYYWTESDGVLVVRPLAAWGNRTHFLHHTLDKLELEKANIAEALHAALGPLRPRAWARGEGMPGVGEITLSKGSISIIDALDAIVREYGHARWEVSYCEPRMQPQYAMVRIYLSSDSHGVGMPALQVRDANGKAVDSCSEPG